MARAQDYDDYYADYAEFGETAEGSDQPIEMDEMDRDGDDTINSDKLITGDETPAAPLQGNEFHETLRDPEFGDQLDDDDLKQAAESDFNEPTTTSGTDERVRPVSDEDLAA